jgi:hypothetical protein
MPYLRLWDLWTGDNNAYDLQSGNVVDV